MELTILILLLPFLSFLLLGIGGKWMSHRTAGTIGTLVLGAVAVLSYVTAFQYFSAPRLEDGTFATLIPYNFTWLPFTETLHFDLGILLDPISVMMLIVISTVSLMVHIYSFGYMKGEVGFQRYYAFLSLFTMSMLGFHHFVLDRGAFGFGSDHFPLRGVYRSEEHTSELQSLTNLVCRLLLEKKNFFNDTATTEIYTLSLHDALPICEECGVAQCQNHYEGCLLEIGRAHV